MSKIETGQINLKEKAIDLYEFLDELQQMLQLKAAAKQIDLHFSCESNVPQHIRVDEYKLRQILLNLLGNAIKFTQVGKVELVACLMEQSSQNPAPLIPESHSSHQLRLRFSVSDTGPGIETKDVERIFQSFFQTQTSKSFGQGAGLGLAISRQFARLMGGEITLESTLGEGSIFHCNILVQRCLPPPLKAKKETPTYRTITGIAGSSLTYRVLVVDDNDDNCLFLYQLLSVPGFEVKMASNGEQAIQIHDDWHPHLIWMDIRMPGIDGLEATRRIRRSDRYPRIIALTANVFAEDRDAAIAAGCDDFMAKPCLPDQILECTARWLEIEFTYETPVSQEVPSVVESVNTLDPIIRAGFQAMPEAWKSQFMSHLRSLKGSELTVLLAKVPPEQRAMQDAMTKLLDDFRYDALITILRDDACPSENHC